MKLCIVGVDVIENFKNKKTGKDDSAVVLQCIRNSNQTFGHKIKDIFIAQSNPIFKKLLPFAKSLDDLVNYEIDAEFNDRGFLDDFELGQKFDHDVINW